MLKDVGTNNDVVARPGEQRRNVADLDVGHFDPPIAIRGGLRFLRIVGHAVHGARLASGQVTAQGAGTGADVEHRTPGRHQIRQDGQRRSLPVVDFPQVDVLVASRCRHGADEWLLPPASRPGGGRQRQPRLAVSVKQGSRLYFARLVRRHGIKPARTSGVRSVPPDGPRPAGLTQNERIS